MAAGQSPRRYFGARLVCATIGISYSSFNGWNAMPNLLRSRHTNARTLAVSYRVETAAFYGALTLIGAVVFGTLSVHPF